jgi:hypothetical protein
VKGIKSITIEEGRSNASLGVVGFKITLDGEKLSSSDLAEAVMLLERNILGKHKVVSIEGVHNEKNETAMYTLLQTLKDYGYYLRVVVDGTLYHTWLKLADFLVVYVLDPLKWTRFGAHQIIYRASDENEPSVPEVSGKNLQTMLYLDTGNLSSEKIKKFLKRAQHRWNIYHEIEIPTIQEVLYDSSLE